MIIKIYTINTLWSVQTLYTRRASTWRYVLPVNFWSGKHYLFFCGTIKHLIQSIRSIIPMNKLLSFFGTVLFCLCIVYAWVFIHLQYTGAQGRCQKIQPIRVAFFFFSNSLHSGMYKFWPGLLIKWTVSWTHTCSVHAVLNMPYIQCVVRL